jgi:hypothetical protein
MGRVAVPKRQARTEMCDHIGCVSRCSVRCRGSTSLRLSSSADGPPAATSRGCASAAAVPRGGENILGASRVELGTVSFAKIRSHGEPSSIAPLGRLRRPEGRDGSGSPAAAGSAAAGSETVTARSGSSALGAAGQLSAVNSASTDPMQGRAPLEASLTRSSGGVRARLRPPAGGSAAGGDPSGRGPSGEVPSSEPSPEELVPGYPGASEAEEPTEAKSVNEYEGSTTASALHHTVMLWVKLLATYLLTYLLTYDLPSEGRVLPSEAMAVILRRRATVGGHGK